MNLQFTDEQEMMRKRIRQFAEEEITPFIAEMEERETFPWAVLTKMSNLGFMGIPIPKQYGGAGMDFTSYIIAIHELSKVSATIGVILAVHTSVGTNPILSFGTEEQKQTYVTPLASGKYLGAFGLTEPGAGSDVAGLKTRAVKEGTMYRLNGSKAFITNGGEADTYIIFASTDPNAGSKGISAFIVEKDTPGFQIGKKEKKMGLNGSNTTELMLDDVLVPAHNLLGKEGEGFKLALANLDFGRIGIAAQSLGIAEAALEAAVAYAKEQKQCDRAIAEQQGIASRLAMMATKVEAAKVLTYRAANLKDAGIRCGKEASMAKLYASKIAVEVSIEAGEVFGPYGYTKDYPVERFFRDAKVCEIYEGTSEIQRMVISKHLFAN